jgi:endonuclease III
MKEAKNFGDKVQQFTRLLKRRHNRIESPVYEEPADALVFAILCEHTTSQQAQTAFKRIKEYFIDLNDIRVSRAEEIAETAGPDTEVKVEDALRAISALKAIFDKYNMVTLNDVKKQGKKQIRDIISRFPGVSDFVADYCMLTAFDAHAIPLTDRMVEYLKAKKIIAPDLPSEQASQMLARHISSKDAYNFYALLRKESEQNKSKKRQKAQRPQPEKTDTEQKPSADIKGEAEKK